ncbi:kinase-like domain-containing protein [Rhizoctonia solani]|nr:kinase-like domain-containing protein [Rhizoctonia solani]
MHDLRTTEGTLAYLNTTRFPATEVQLLSGGNSAFTFRATLKTPLPSGEKTVVLKHAEKNIALTFYDPGLKIGEVDAQRNEFEYNALVAITESGLCGPESIVRPPRPLYYDPETHTTFMADLGSPIPLQKLLQDEENSNHQLASDIGSALGDFLGRLHNWTSAPEQASLRALISQNNVAKQCLAMQHTFAHETVAKLGLREQWVEDSLSRDLEDSAAANDVWIWGDSWPGNILVSPPSATQGLRIYLTDWEMSRLGPPEFDIGEAVGVAMSLVYKRYPQGDHPYIQALHRSYRQHRSVDPIKAARSTGVAIIGHSFVMPWVCDKDEQSQRSLASTGIDLMKVAYDGDVDEIKKRGLVKELFTS